jgi:hypothetical protein
MQSKFLCSNLEYKLKDLFNKTCNYKNNRSLPEIAPISQGSQLYPTILDACDSRKLPKNPPKHRNPLIKIDFPHLKLIIIQKQSHAIIEHEY